ncbi:mechanosensitive ion channel family protein [Microscilla marina]|uniref:Transporter, small conductance mechanosensitive ion channel (MscS) family n=1 Tax=Microscilla marina ATCC 23134 TaxID=313606 RepID=A1ZCV5_MICM2|nr:mechanosensitive ion channel family protein [Microscilla marina]EAY31494.1 transporter, small conductance mechanosensitive ion channel (MscS) family [Microscilla marina ATCC 23134]
MHTKKTSLYFAFIFLLFSHLAFGQGSKRKTANLNTPYHAVSTHIDNLQTNNYHPEIAAQALFRGGKYASIEKREELAKRLLKILDARGLRVDYSKLPKDPKYVDTTASEANKKIYILFPKELPEVYVEKVGSQWLYSEYTLDRIPDLYRSIGMMEKIIHKFPDWVTNKVLGMTLFHYLSLLVLLIFSFFLHKIFSYIFRNLITRLIVKLGKGQRGTNAKKLIQSIARPASLFLIVRIWIWILPIFQFPLSFTEYVVLFLKVVLPVFGMMIGNHLVDFVALYMGKLAEKTEGTLDDQLIPLIKKALITLVYIIGFIFILNALNFDVTTILAGLSIGGLAFAFAAQDTIKNLFGSFTIFMDRPFQVGDWIVAENINGTVEEVGFRSTRIRTFSNSVMYVSNGKLANMVIDNMGVRAFRRYSTTLGLTYDTPPELIDAFVKGLRQIILEHPDTRKDYFQVYLNDFAGSSLNILFYSFFTVNDWGVELRARHELMMNILRLAYELGVRFAFPTQTIHVEDLPGQKGLTPTYSDSDLNEENLNKKIKQFIAAQPDGKTFHAKRNQSKSAVGGDSSGDD